MGRIPPASVQSQYLSDLQYLTQCVSHHAAALRLAFKFSKSKKGRATIFAASPAVKAGRVGVTRPEFPYSSELSNPLISDAARHLINPFNFLSATLQVELESVNKILSRIL